MWMLAFGHHQDRTQTFGYAPRRETAMAACGAENRAPRQRAGIEERIKPSSIFPLRIAARRQLEPCLHVSRPYIRRQVNENAFL